MKRIFAACLGLCGLASVALAADTHWPIATPALARDELIAIALPTPLFANGRADATTLRVQNDQDGEVPARYEPLQTLVHARRRISTPAFTLVAAETPDGALRLTLRRPSPSAPSALVDGTLEGLAIETPLRDFEQRATVEGSDDGVNWTTLVAQALLFDFSRHADVRRTEIVFPLDTTNRHLRLTFERAVDAREQLTALITATQLAAGGTTESRAVNVDTRPFHVAAVRGWTSSQIETSRKPVLSDYPITWIALTNGVPRNQTRYAIDAQGQPLTRLTVAIPSDYASWHYTLTTDPATTARPLAQGVLTQFRFRGTVTAATSIVLPETRAQRYWLTFDQPRATVSAITADGPRYRLIFPARPQQDYRLIQLREPETRIPDTMQIAALLARDIQPIEATLVMTPRPAGAQRCGYDWFRRHVLHIGIGAALLALAASLVRAMRRL